LYDGLCIVIESQSVMEDTPFVGLFAISMEVLVFRLAPDHWKQPQEQLRLLVGRG
jgi:hypothetical protein